MLLLPLQLGQVANGLLRSDDNGCFSLQVAATRCFPRRPSPAWVGLPLSNGHQPMTPPPVLTLIDLTGRFFPHVNPRPFRPGPVRRPRGPPYLSATVPGSRRSRPPCQRPYSAFSCGIPRLLVGRGGCGAGPADRAISGGALL